MSAGGGGGGGGPLEVRRGPRVAEDEFNVEAGFGPSPAEPLPALPTPPRPTPLSFRSIFIFPRLHRMQISFSLPAASAPLRITHHIPNDTTPLKYRTIITILAQ